MYGTPFRSQFASEAAVTEWVDTWARGLAGLTPEQLKTGLTRCVEEHPQWAPTLGQFRALCLPAAAEPVRPEHRLLSFERPQAVSREALAKVEAMAAQLRRTPSEHDGDRYRWALKVASQDAVDFIARGGRDSVAVLEYMRERGVIDANNRLVRRAA